MLPTRGVHLSIGLRLQSFRAKTDVHHKSHSHELSDQAGIMWSKASGIQTHSYQSEYPKGLEIISQEVAKGQYERKDTLENVQVLKNPGLLH